MDGCMDVWMDEWTDGWMDGWMNKEMDGLKSSNTHGDRRRQHTNTVTTTATSRAMTTGITILGVTVDNAIKHIIKSCLYTSINSNCYLVLQNNIEVVFTRTIVRRLCASKDMSFSVTGNGC